LIHNRDHEHGGTDTVRIHYEDVGTSGGGGGGGAAPQGVYTIAYTAAPTGIQRIFDWTYVGGDHLLDLTSTSIPVTVDAGVYSYVFGAYCAVIITTGEYARFTFQATGSSGFDCGSGPLYPVQAAIAQVIGAHATLVAHQDAGGPVYATVTNQSASSRNYNGDVFVQKLS
jgi:hypothetical protein